MPITKADAGFGVTVDDLARVGIGNDAGGQVDRSTGTGDFVLQFRTMRDSRVRPEHAALEGRIWELDDPDAPNPPLAPGCRCEVHIVPRSEAEKREAETPAESLEQFKDLEKNLATAYPADVVAGYESGHLLPEDLIIRRTGDRLTTDQARAVIGSRKAGTPIRDALQAVAALADRGLSGRVLAPIVTEARRQIAAGASPLEAARTAIMGTARRGTVTATTAGKAAAEMVRARLLDAEAP